MSTQYVSYVEFVSAVRGSKAKGKKERERERERDGDGEKQLDTAAVRVSIGASGACCSRYLHAVYAAVAFVFRRRHRRRTNCLIHVSATVLVI